MDTGWARLGEGTARRAGGGWAYIVEECGVLFGVDGRFRRARAGFLGVAVVAGFCVGHVCVAGLFVDGFRTVGLFVGGVNVVSPFGGWACCVGLVDVLVAVGLLGARVG
jgi:hypothetical protein